MNPTPTPEKRSLQPVRSYESQVILLLLEMLRSSLSEAVTKNDLKETEEKIMSQVSDYIAQVNTRFDALDAANEANATAATGIADDVKFLKETITRIENSPGPISAEDQASLTAALGRLDGLASKVEAQKTALTALDAATERPSEPASV